MADQLWNAPRLDASPATDVEDQDTLSEAPDMSDSYTDIQGSDFPMTSITGDNYSTTVRELRQWLQNSILTMFPSSAVYRAYVIL